MFINNLVEEIKGSAYNKYIYHFTDSRNLPDIKSRGLLSKTEMQRLGFQSPHPSGNKWSWDGDRIKGISDYVSLCFTDRHPMCYVAEHKGKRIQNPKYLCIKPEILLQDGVMFAAGIANATSTRIMPLAEAAEVLDVEVLYRWTNWKDAEVKARRDIVRKYELLVPKRIPFDMIVGTLRRN